MDMIATTFGIACSFRVMETAFRGSQGASSVKRTHLDWRPTGDGGVVVVGVVNGNQILRHGFSSNGVGRPVDLPSLCRRKGRPEFDKSSEAASICPRLMNDQKAKSTCREDRCSSPRLLIRLSIE